MRKKEADPRQVTPLALPPALLRLAVVLLEIAKIQAPRPSRSKGAEKVEVSDD